MRENTKEIRKQMNGNENERIFSTVWKDAWKYIINKKINGNLKTVYSGVYKQVANMSMADNVNVHKLSTNKPYLVWRPRQC